MNDKDKGLFTAQRLCLKTAALARLALPFSHDVTSVRQSEALVLFHTRFITSC